jgi:hypothetical protein
MQAAKRAESKTEEKDFVAWENDLEARRLLYPE